MIAALDHAYGEPEWAWTDDYSSATAKFVCENDESHVETMTAEITSETTAPAGSTVYNATVTFNGNVYTDSKTVELPLTASNITSNSVSFDGKLFLNTYILLNKDVEADEGAYVSVTFNGDFNGETPKTTIHLVSELIKNKDDQGRVKVRQEVYAAMMRDEMTIQLFSGDEALPLTYKETEDVKDGFTYTVLTYLKDRQEYSTNPEMVELARAAELYGIAAQVYFKYKTEQLAEEDIAMMQAAAAKITIPNSCAGTVSGTLPDGITKQTMTVMFMSDNALRQYFYLDDADKYTFTLNGEEVTPTEKNSGCYYVEMSNIASGLLSTVYTFTVSDGKNTYTIKSSALGYAYGRQENSSNEAMVNLAKLLYRYSLAADAYFDEN